MMPGMVASRIPTPRLRINTLEVDRRTGVPVVFVHGNVSSAVFWQQTMLNLPAVFRPIAIDLRGYGDTDPLPIDGSRGVRDFADDVAGLLDALGLDHVHLVGWSIGAGVTMQLLPDQPGRFTSMTLVNPISPYGFGGTHGPEGRLNDPSGAGSGGGAANPDFVARLAAGDRSDEAPTSPRQIMLATYVKPPFVPELADEFVESMLTTRIGDDHHPGDHIQVDAWPGIGPGTRGVLNTMAPTHFRLDDLPDVDPKPPIRWIRGSDDQIVSDTSLHDLGYLGSIGAVPGWPGVEVAPPQPMIAQTRAVLDRYAAAGGTVTEMVIDGTAHSPHVEKPAEFRAALLGAIE
jgi:pimeloyl-ACP methyl ester carboxylesterase